MTTLARLTSASVLILASGLVAWSAELTTLAGTKAVGTLTQVDAQSVMFHEDGRPAPTKFAVKELAAIDLKNKVAAPPAGAKYDEVELTDGSLLRGTDLRIKGRAVELGLLPGPSGVSPPALRVELGHLFWVLRGAGEAARAEWKKFVAGRGKRDLFVVRQSEGLNPLAGTVIEGNPSGERVTFEREDGNRASLPLARASGGLVFNQPARDVIPPTVCRVYDVFGNVWYAAAVEVVGSGLRVRAVCGATVEYPSAQAVASLDFSQGNVEYLARMTADVAYPPPETDGPLGERYPFAPRVAADKAIGGADLVLDGRKFAQGVSVPPDTTLTYKVEGFREFKATVGLPDSTRPEDAALTLRIEIDGRPVLAEKVSKKDKPREVTLNVKDAKELKITVERDALFAGNQLTLADARVQK